MAQSGPLTTKAIAALIQRMESMERQVSGLQGSGFPYEMNAHLQRVDNLENLVVGLRHQVENLAAQMASLALQMRSVVATAVQEQMSFVWEQQLELVQRHAANTEMLEEKLQRHETKLDHHSGLLQAGVNFVDHDGSDQWTPTASGHLVNGLTTALGTLGLVQATPLHMASPAPAPGLSTYGVHCAGDFEPLLTASDAQPSSMPQMSSHVPGHSTPSTAPGSPWMCSAMAAGSSGPPGVLLHELLSNEATASVGSHAVPPSHAQTAPDVPLHGSTSESANGSSPEHRAAAIGVPEAPQATVAVSTDVISDGEATLSAGGSAPDKYGEDTCSDAPSGTHSIASVGPRYGWPLQPKSLFHAINSKDEAMVLAILACPDFVELNATNEQGCTALHRAAWYGLAEACQALLDRPEFNSGAHADANGWTALHCAGARGQLEACKVLLRHPGSAAAVFEQDRCGCTPLHRAVLSGRGEVCRLLLKHPGLSEDCPPAADGRTALHCAASGGHAEACLVLLEHPIGKTALTMRDASGSIPLEVALGKAKQVLANADQRVDR